MELGLTTKPFNRRFGDCSDLAPLLAAPFNVDKSRHVPNIVLVGHGALGLNVYFPDTYSASLNSGDRRVQCVIASRSGRRIEVDQLALWFCAGFRFGIEFATQCALANDKPNGQDESCDCSDHDTFVHDVTPDSKRVRQNIGHHQAGRQFFPDCPNNFRRFGRNR